MIPDAAAVASTFDIVSNRHSEQNEIELGELESRINTSSVISGRALALPVTWKGTHHHHPLELLADKNQSLKRVVIIYRVPSKHNLTEYFEPQLIWKRDILSTSRSHPIAPED